MKFLVILLLFLAIPVWAKELELEPIDSIARSEYIERAQVWFGSDVSKKDLLAGPSTSIAAPLNSLVTCRYVEWKEPPSGATPKFLCKLQKNAQVVRVKYGKETREIFSEVIATRLFWALGFPTDILYPVRLKCIGCPEKNPFQPEEGERRVTRIIDYAVMEKNFDGEMIEEKEDQGISWKEIDTIDPERGGAPDAHLAALKLLGVFVQHGDNKPEQQRLACFKEDLRDPDGDGKAFCSRPVIMVQDLGATFGAANEISNDATKVNFEGWKNKEIWNHYEENQFLLERGQKICIGNLVNSKMAGEDGLHDPVIDEIGRKFLAELLMQLTDEQIRDLFVAARVDKMDEMVKENGVERRVTVEDWVQAFKEKRKQIVDRQCPVVIEQKE